MSKSVGEGGAGGGSSRTLRGAGVWTNHPFFAMFRGPLTQEQIAARAKLEAEMKPVMEKIERREAARAARAARLKEREDAIRAATNKSLKPSSKPAARMTSASLEAKKSIVTTIAGGALAGAVIANESDDDKKP